MVSDLLGRMIAGIDCIDWLQLPDDARALAIQQLQTLAGVTRGLTRTNDSLLIFDDSPDIQKELERMKVARQDPRVVQIGRAHV